MASILEFKSAGNLTAAAPVTITFAAAPAQGELIAGFIRHLSSDSTGFTLPAGFSLTPIHAVSNLSLFLVWKVAGSSETDSYTFGFTSNEKAVALWRISGADQLNPIGAVIGTNSVTTYAGGGFPLSSANVQMEAGAIALAALNHLASGSVITASTFSDGFAIAGSEYRVAVAAKSVASAEDVNTTWSSTEAYTSSLRGTIVQINPTVSPFVTPDTDAAANQYQLKSFTLSNFTSPITSATVNGTAAAFTQVDAVVSVRMPGNLPTGSYTVTASNADEGASTSINLTQTHPIASLEPGKYDSKSLYAGQGTSFPAGSYDLLPLVFEKVGGGDPITIVFKPPYTGWHDAPLADNVADYLELPAGAEGQYSAEAEKLLPDGSTLVWEITLDTAEVVPAEPPVFLGHIGSRKSRIGTGGTWSIAGYFTGATSYAATGLPTGATLNTTTGVITFSFDTSTQSASVALSATNETGTTAANAFTWAVVISGGGRNPFLSFAA